MDVLTRFAFADYPIRGAIVQLSDVWQAAASRNESSLPILGEALCAAALMSSTIKIEGSVALQLQGGRDLELLYAQCDNHGRLRGVVQSAEGTAQDFASAVEGGVLAVTLEARERYQGIVPLSGSSLGACLEAYYRQSEQLQTKLVLTAEDERAAGLLLQRLPEEDANDEDFHRLCVLTDTLRSRELLQLPPVEVLRRLFHREGEIMDLGRWNLQFGCQCSRQRVAEVLRQLGADELRRARDGDPELVVKCQFCGETYHFDAIELRALDADASWQPAPDTRQ